MRRLLALAVPLVLAACGPKADDRVSAPAPGSTRVAAPDGAEVGTFRGHYARGFEVESFRPCGREGAWWVTEDADLRERYAGVARAPYEAVFVVVRGTASPPGRYGHMGASTRELAVDEVLEIRPAAEGDCGA